MHVPVFRKQDAFYAFLSKTSFTPFFTLIIESYSIEHRDIS